MLKLYYDDVNYFEVAHMPLNLYHLQKISEQRKLKNLGWGTVCSFTGPVCSAAKALTYATMQTFTSNTPLYLLPSRQMQTKWSLRYGTSGNYRLITIVYDDIDVQIFRFYTDWESNSEIRFASFFSSEGSSDGYEDNINQAREFIDRAFWFEQKILSQENIEGNEPIDVELLGLTPLTSPLVLAHCPNDDLTGEVFGDTNKALLGWGSAANIAQALLQYRVIPSSTFKTSSGNYLPSVAYDPNSWSSEIWSGGGEYAYTYSESNNSKDAPCKWNTNLRVLRETTATVSKSWTNDTATAEVQFALPFVQFGTITTVIPKDLFNMVNKASLYGYENYWINDVVGYGTSGTNYYTIVQLRDYNSIKNMALLNKSSLDTFKIASEDFPDISSLAIMTINRTYNNAIADATTRNQVQFVVSLTNANTNQISGQNIIDNFFSSNEDTETPDEPKEPDASDTIPGDTGGGGTTSNDKEGGDGTWSDSGDDTTVSSDYPNNDVIAGVPSGMFGGLDNNTYVVRMNSEQLSKLMQTVWDESFIDYLYTKLGRDGVSQGVLDIKYGNISIPTKSEAVLQSIAGFSLTDTINCSTINQFERFSFGKISVPKYFGSFLDYEPYTQITLYLPKVQSGIAIPANLVVGKSIEVILTVDFVSGLGVYIIQNDDKTQIASVECVVLEEMPYAARDYGGSIGANIDNVGRAAQNTASNVSMYNAARDNYKNASAAYAEAEQAALAESIAEDDLLVKYNPAAAVTTARTNFASMAKPVAPSAGGAVAGGIAAAVVAAKTAWNMTTNFASTWNPGSASRLGGNNVAILKISRSYVQYPEGYTDLYGLPSSQIGLIGDCKGYFEVDKIYPEFSAPADEMQELERLLIAGVYA